VGRMPDSVMTAGWRGWSSESVFTCSILWTIFCPSTTCNSTQEWPTHSRFTDSRIMVSKSMY